MKKKIAMLAVLVMAVIASAYSVSGTYAKYTSTFNGSADSARVAKWAFELNDSSVTNSFTFDLFNTIKDTDGSNETDVDSTTTIIAPGTQGSFDIKLANKSEVNATYSIDYTITNTDNIPVEFSVDGSTWTTDLADVSATPINMGADKTITVQWRWTFEGTSRDTTDTNLGTAGTAEITVDADITVTQVD